MSNFVTRDIMNASKYSNSEIKHVEDRITEKFDVFLDEDILDPIFGTNPRLEGEVFMKRTCKKCPWLFNSEALREILKKRAKFYLRH